MFKDYDLHKVGVLSTRIEDMDALSLYHWLSKFVMEVTKKSGERYPPETVYGIVCRVRRYLGCGVLLKEEEAAIFFFFFFTSEVY